MVEGGSREGASLRSARCVGRGAPSGHGCWAGHCRVYHRIPGNVFPAPGERHGFREAMGTQGLPGAEVAHLTLPGDQDMQQKS